MEEKQKCPLNEEKSFVENEKNYQKTGLLTQLKNEFKVDKEMVSMKAAMCCCMAGFYSFFPYLTLHMQVLGIEMDKIAITYAILPFAAFAGPILSGIIADKLGRYTWVLCGNIALTGLLHTLLLFVPHNRRDTMEFHCTADVYSLSWRQCSQDFLQYQISFPILLQDCVSNCEQKNSSDVSLCFSNASENFTFCTPESEMEQGVLLSGTFSEIYDGSNCTLSLSDINYEGTAIDTLTCPSDCHMTCQVHSANYDDEMVASSSNTPFYIYLICRILGTLFLNASFAMQDAVLLAKVRETKSHFGKQRCFSLLSQAFAPLIAGVLVDLFNSKEEIIDYGPTIYFGDALMILAIMIYFTMDLKIEQAKENMLINVGKLLSRIEIDIFLMIIIFLGTLWGFLETYLFLYLDDLNAPTYMLGLTLMVGCASGVPAMFFADSIIKKIGRSTVFLISFIAYFVRFLGYSYITSPWYCFPFELLEIITYQLLWVATATLFPILAPPELLATMSGIGGAAHYSLGRGLGSFVGGFFIKWYGLRMTFRGFAYVALGGGALYIITNQLALKKRVKKREMILKLEEMQNIDKEKSQAAAEMLEMMKDSSRRNSLV